MNFPNGNLLQNLKIHGIILMDGALYNHQFNLLQWIMVDIIHIG